MFMFKTMATIAKAAQRRLSWKLMLAGAFVAYTNANKAKFFKDGQWTFPRAVLAEAARQQGLADLCLQDAWGQGFKLVRFDADRRNAVLIAMGEPTDTDYEIAEDAEPCDKCRALGQVVTGSKVPGQFTKLCAKCNGSGWVPKVMTAERLYAMPTPAALPPIMTTGGFPSAVAAPTTDPYPGYGIPFVPVPNGVEDGWHRPAGHPHWGLDPATVNGGGS